MECERHELVSSENSENIVYLQVQDLWQIGRKHVFRAVRVAPVACFSQSYVGREQSILCDWHWHRNEITMCPWHVQDKWLKTVIGGSNKTT
jgi:hypothetical protein